MKLLDLKNVMHIINERYSTYKVMVTAFGFW